MADELKPPERPLLPRCLGVVLVVSTRRRVAPEGHASARRHTNRVRAVRVVRGSSGTNPLLRVSSARGSSSRVGCVTIASHERHPTRLRSSDRRNLGDPRSPDRASDGPVRCRPANRDHDRRGRARRSHHRHGLPRHQPRQPDARRSSRPTPTGAPLFSNRGRQACKPGTPVSHHRSRARPSDREPDRTSRPASTGCSRSSTSTPVSPAPTATRCGCTWINGKARTGNGRPATSTAIRCKVQIDPRVDGADSPRRRQSDPADSSRRPTRRLVKRIKIQSEILTKWWGHPIFLGATILLPKDYDEHPDVRYPVNYIQGHFSLRAPGGFGRGGDVRQDVARADDTPRFIYVTLQHPSPYYDDSYGVNSENNGPFGDAIMQELAAGDRNAVPRHPRAVGAHAFRRIDRRLDRRRAPDLLSRTSTAARSPAAPIRSTSIITRSSTSTRTPTPTSSTRAGCSVDRPNQRRPDGNIVSMMKDENHYELDRRRQVALGRPVGHLGGDLLARRRGRLPAAPLGQNRPAQSITPSRRSGSKYDLLRRPQNQLDHAGAEDRHTS